MLQTQLKNINSSLECNKPCNGCTLNDINGNPVRLDVNGLVRDLITQNASKANATLRQLLQPETDGRPLPTEQRNRTSMQLSEMNSLQICNLMWQDTQSAEQTLKHHLPAISLLIDQIICCLNQDGRLIYVGAGNSGRLAVLDAIECTPTFGCPAHQVQALLAGGSESVIKEIDGVEDDALSGLQMATNLKLTKNDYVLGITASGQTAFVWGALYAAAQAGSCTGLICFNPHIKPKFELNHLISMDCGPEILTGSTRLKCGTITKMVLNMISTAAMVQIGKCISNLMAEVLPMNSKLKQRLANVLVALVNDEALLPEQMSTATAHELLIQHDYKVRNVMHSLRANSK